MHKLTSRMQEAFQAAKDNGGELYRHKGGFWAPRRALLRKDGVPKDWYATGQTIHALIDRNALDVVERLPLGDPLAVCIQKGCELRQLADGVYVY